MFAKYLLRFKSKVSVILISETNKIEKKVVDLSLSFIFLIGNFNNLVTRDIVVLLMFNRIIFMIQNKGDKLL